MPREIDPKRTRKALRAVRRLKAAPAPIEADAARASDVSAWESEFLDSLEQRLDEYGSAFADRSKGGADEALSWLQAAKLKEIARKQRKALRAAAKDAPKQGVDD